MKPVRLHFMVCGGTGCHSTGSGELLNALKREIKAAGISDEIRVITTGCFGFCEQGSIVKVYPDNILYVRVKPEDAEEIIKEHAVKGRVVTRLLYKDPKLGEYFSEHKDIGFYKNQIRVALRNCGVIDPENISEYISVGGYDALAKSIFELKPDEIISEIKKSGLRGRGGAGFPTGLKWETCKSRERKDKYVICNADEGDPGAFMDRSILEGDPHSILEAMAICGYAIGSKQGIIYIRAEYPLAVKRLETAISQAEELGLLGNDILGSGFDFNITLSLGAGAFVCGEETSLMNSVEGGRGEPHIKPPFPAESGLKSCPTNINNVETFANICPIITRGADWYRSIGTEKSPGTKVFALAGKVNNVGLVEVPMGIPLRAIIEDIGGGIRDGKKFKAVQIGGPSGGCLSKDMLNTPVDYESLANVGCPMGSGGMIAMDEDSCMVNMAEYFLEFTAEESCGKCTPCRVGNRRMLEILRRMTAGNGENEDIEALKALGNIIKDTSLCGLGQGAPNPVLSMIKNFPEEYIAHTNKKLCPANACEAMKKYEIIPEKCIGCTLCAKNCPVNCILGELKGVHEIDKERCIKCGICYRKCPTSAIIQSGKAVYKND